MNSFAYNIGLVKGAYSKALSLPPVDHPHPEDAPGSALPYMRAVTSNPKTKPTFSPEVEPQPKYPRRYTITPRSLLNPVYGDRTNAEYASAITEAKKRGLPWGVPTAPWPRPGPASFVETAPRIGLDTRVGVIDSPEPGWHQSSQSAYLPYSPKAYDVVPEGDTIWGTPPGRFYNNTRAVLKHEVLGHGLYGGYYHPISDYGSRSGGGTLGAPLLDRDLSTYPEIYSDEFPPAAVALQHHNFRRTGSRITSDAGYADFLRRYDNKATDRRRLPIEVQRWLNYRDTVRNDPDTERRIRRLRYLDDNMKFILPAIAQQRNVPGHLKQAYATGFAGAFEKTAQALPGAMSLVMTPYELGIKTAQQTNVSGHLKTAYFMGLVKGAQGKRAAFGEPYAGPAYRQFPPEAYVMPSHPDYDPTTSHYDDDGNWVGDTTAAQAAEYWEAKARDLEPRQSRVKSRLLEIISRITQQKNAGRCR